VADQQPKRRRFQKVKFDSKTISKRMKRAEGVTTRHAHRFIVRRIDSVRNVQRHIIGWLFLVGCLIAASGIQLAWFQQSYQTTAAETGGTYSEGVLGPINTLNPLYASSDAELSTARLLFSSLYAYDSTGHLHTDLAKSMEVDATGKIYTIALRGHTKWDDGKPLTAKDVAFTINLIKNSEARATPSLQATWQDVSVKALDDTTVQFTLPAVYAAFPYALTFSVLPEHILGPIAPGAIRENTFSRAPVGSGPFMFNLLQSVDTNTDKKVVQLSVSPTYYGGEARLHRFEIHTYTSQEVIVKALKAGEVNAAEVLPSLSKNIDRGSYSVTTQPLDSGVYALFNINKPILKDVQVRRALQLVTNTVALRKQLNVGVPALDLPFVNGQVTGSDVPHAPSPDTKKAAELLDAAGWKLVGHTRQNGEQKLALTITTTKDNQYEKVANALASQWKAIGVDVKINVIDTTNPSVNFVENTLQPRNYDVLLYELLIGADPDVYAYWHSSQIGMNGYNFSNYVDQSADTALASARSRLEPQLRNEKYKAFARQWLSDVPAIGLYQSVATYAVNIHAQSVDPTMKLVSPTDRYANILEWSVQQKSVYKTP
jgi:peptide/nickel transport system substrate-binding protein